MNLERKKKEIFTKIDTLIAEECPWYNLPQVDISIFKNIKLLEILNNRLTPILRAVEKKIEKK
jgi:hypothetical protein